MPGAETVALLLVASLPTAVLGGVVGFGTGVLMLPLVAWTVGVRAAVPVLSIALLLGNVSRAWLSRRELDWRVIGAYLSGAGPAAVLGSLLFVQARLEWLAQAMGLFLLLAVPLRRWMERGPRRMRLAHFPLLGAVAAFLSALLAATGPVNTPFFLGYGLRRGAYVGTEAVCAGAVHVVKTLVYGRYALLPSQSAGLGLAMGAVMFVGAWIGRALLTRMSDRAFVLAIDILMALFGLLMLVHGPV